MSALSRLKNLPLRSLKTLLVQPLYDRKVIGPSLGLGYIGASLQAKGVQVKTISFRARRDVESLEEFKAEESYFLKELSYKINYDNYHIVGIRATTATYPRSLNIARMAKEQGCVVILGGPHVNVMESTRGLEGHILKNSPDIDILVKGEGEKTIAELVVALCDGSQDITKIPGTTLRNGEEIIVNKWRDPVVNIDELPFPAWDLFPIKYSPEIAYLMTIRGCLYKCKYCDEWKIFPGFRYRSPENIVAELERNLDQFGIRAYRLADPVFTSHPQLKELCEAMIARGLPVHWGAHGHVEEVAKNPALLKLMKKAGCEVISFGIESGDPGILTAMNRPDAGKTMRAVQAAKEVDIKVKGSFILGFPGETISSMEKTIKFAEELGLDIYNWYPYTPGINDLKPEQIMGIDPVKIGADVPEHLIPLIFKDADPADNILVRHLIAGGTQETGYYKHVSGLTYNELYRLLGYAMRQTKQNPRDEERALLKSINPKR